jgi:uncharacterized membrane protein
MSSIIVLTFHNATDAGKVRQTIRDQQRAGHISIDDAAVIVKEADGKIRVDNEVDRGVKIGAVGGGILGALLSFLFPLAGIVVGAAGGALVGSTLGMGVDQKFVKDVSESLQPNNSALFLIVRDANLDVTISALEPFEGTVYHTSLNPDVEQALRDALK